MLAIWILTSLIAGGLLLWFWTTQPLVLTGRTAARGDGADPARLKSYVKALAEDYLPRDFGHPENLAAAAEWIAAQLQTCGGRVSEQVFGVNAARYRNVVASYGPETQSVVVVGGHYDTDGEMPGADDNASGVAGLLELARLLSREELLVRVELVAYALEEMPAFGTSWMGSAVHANSLRESGRHALGMICLEMTGCFLNEPGSQRFPFPLLRLFYPGRGNFIAVVGNLGGVALVRRVKRSMRSSGPLPVYSINAPAIVPGVDLSDHSSYWREGFPAVMITDTAFYRNDRYHTADDTPDTLDYDRMAKVIDGVFRATLDLARATDPVEQTPRASRSGGD